MFAKADFQVYDGLTAEQLRHGKSIDLDKTLESTKGGCKTGVVILDRGKSPLRTVATEVIYVSD